MPSSHDAIYNEWEALYFTYQEVHVPDTDVGDIDIQEVLDFIAERVAEMREGGVVLESDEVIDYNVIEMDVEDEDYEEGTAANPIWVPDGEGTIDDPIDLSIFE